MAKTEKIDRKTKDLSVRERGAAGVKGGRTMTLQANIVKTTTDTQTAITQNMAG